MSAARTRVRGLPVATNYRGAPVPVVLGVFLTATVVAWVGVGDLIVWWAAHGHLDAARRRLGWILLGLVLVFLAGLFDDFRAYRSRGLRAQLLQLVRGRVTPGILKLLGIAAASAFVTWMLGARGWRFVLATGVVAGSANLWNLFDVRPGRSLKLFLPAAGGLLASAHGFEYRSVLAAAFGSAVVLVVIDLLEWGMLGDSGSNVLGFVTGVGLVSVLRVGGLAVALVLLVALHVLADTVTLSRVIDATPPLRWLDRLGRRKSDTID